ncbi:MAG: Si-specific NAD(P)(+) transhydrogenase [Parachlamydiales bacterium]
MEKIEADLVVIGSGPAGQKGAIQAAKLGKRVVVIESDANPGGASLNSGTIPSKSLREAILDLTRFNERSFYGKEIKYEGVSINRLNHRLRRVLEEERKNLFRHFRKNGIRLIPGFARFIGPSRVEVEDAEHNLHYQIEGRFFLLATGSKPRNPTNIPFDKEVILDSTRLLDIDQVPESLLVLGSGVIGSEYASFFAALGTKVTVVDKRDHMLPLLDSEIGTHLQAELGDLGLKFLPRKTVRDIKRAEGHALLSFDDGTTLESDKLLYALGRTANIAGMNLEQIGVAITDRGNVAVNDFFQTSLSHIYAAGDVIGGPCLASTSMEQGRLVSCHAFGAQATPFPKAFPIGIYTIPEISCIGYTEEQLQQKNIQYEVGRAYYYEIARGQISGSTRGLFKLLFHPETREILGVHILGRSATETIHIGQVAMSFNARIDYFVSHIFNYPTFAEGYRIAALNGINKLSRRS